MDGLERNAARSSAWPALRESGVEDGEVGGLAVWRFAKKP